ncbi:hypothetical protein [Pseudopedobacter beijingensis]|uniref:YD repeat-containing protein n=1 Tax=Pseudopedobacter beijingensis TaxID=1207056 RepID=A0ABW4IBI2_9SPHI
MKKILMLAFTATMMLVACKKDKGGDEPETIPTCATVKTVERLGNSVYNNTNAIKFDSQGRIKEENDTFESFLYEYQSDKITVTYSYPGNEYLSTLTLDNKGRVTKIDNRYGTFEYEYNSDGYLIKETSTEAGSATTSFTWESGNLVKIVKTNNGTSYTTNITYSNDVITDKLIAANVYDNIYGFDTFRLYQYFGKHPKNAPILEQNNNTNSGYTANYSYTKDNNGKINAFNIESISTNNPYEWGVSVDYNCK